MTNHYFDDGTRATRCGEYAGDLAWHVSSANRVSCPDCRERLTPEEREGQWYPFDEEPKIVPIEGAAPEVALAADDGHACALCGLPTNDEPCFGHSAEEVGDWMREAIRGLQPPAPVVQLDDRRP